MAMAVSGFSSMHSAALPTQSATGTPESQSRFSSQHPQQPEGEEEGDDKHQEQQQQQQQQQEDDYLFSCRCDSAKAVASLLSCLTVAGSGHKSNTTLQPVTVFCTPTALTFHVYGTTAKQSQASVDISKSLFCHYQVQEGEFCVNLTSVMECLSILGLHHLERTKLCWAYSPASQTFEMELLEEGGVLSTAAIPCLMPPTAPTKSLALAFSQSPIVSRILLKSEWLKQAGNELEHVPGATTCTIAMSQKALQLATAGHHSGECVVSLPNTPTNQASGALLSLECSDDSSTDNKPRSYPWTSFRLGMKGLDIAEETCLTINQAGMCAIQHQVLDPVNGDGEANFVDFLMACLETDQDEEQGQQEEPNVPPPLSLGWKSQEEGAENQDSDSDEEQDGGANDPPISAAPLFGTVVAEDASVATARSRSRNVRRRHNRQTRAGRTIEVDHSHQFSQEDNDDDDEPLDITASVSTPTRRRRRHPGRASRHQSDGDSEDEEGASSPEIGYGEDE